MSKEWEPGDVAALTIAGEQVVGVVQAEKSAGALLWQIGGHSFYLSIAVGNAVLIQDARPLVVIDPESREDVERLRDLMDTAYAEQSEGSLDSRHTGARGNAMQAALREFADPKPPKPDEPTGLGAVVEDAVGNWWVRHYDGWRHCDGNSARALAWREIDAVRVLSEGVQP